MPNETVKIEIKVNTMPGRRWEDTPSKTIEVPVESLDDCVKAIADFFDRQVRWNYINSTQGHYVWPANYFRWPAEHGKTKDVVLSMPDKDNLRPTTLCENCEQTIFSDNEMYKWDEEDSPPFCSLYCAQVYDC